MKREYKGNNNVRPTAPLHNLKLQIDRLEWLYQQTPTIDQFMATLLLNTKNELKSILTDLSNPSKAFTIWTETDLPILYPYNPVKCFFCKNIFTINEYIKQHPRKQWILCSDCGNQTPNPYSK